MEKVVIEQSSCPANHPCPVMRVCPVGAIKQATPFSAPVIDEEKCTNCGKCTSFCPFGAFHFN